MLGICLLLAPIWFSGQNVQASSAQTAAPFKYLLLATLTPIPSVEPETTSPLTPLPARTEPSAEVLAPAPPQVTEQTGDASPAIEQPQITVTGDVFVTPIITVTTDSLFAGSIPMTAGIYDDSDPRIIRKGSWKPQGHEDAYQETLLVSNTIGNYMIFSFTGGGMMLGYLSDDAGDMIVNIDGTETIIVQLIGDTWFSQDLEPGTHYVILTHESGASVNLDFVEITD